MSADANKLQKVFQDEPFKKPLCLIMMTSVILMGALIDTEQMLGDEGWGGRRRAVTTLLGRFEL